MSAINTKEEAVTAFKALIARYGVVWTPEVPASAYTRLAECNRFLSEADRRAAVRGRL